MIDPDPSLLAGQRELVEVPSGTGGHQALGSSRMRPAQVSTHSSQIKTVGPAISFLTSCWALPQKEQKCWESPAGGLVLAARGS